METPLILPADLFWHSATDTGQTQQNSVLGVKYGEKNWKEINILTEELHTHKIFKITQVL